MESMQFSFLAKKLVIWISLILLIVSLGKYVHHEIYPCTTSHIYTLYTLMYFDKCGYYMVLISFGKFIIRIGLVVSASAISEKGQNGICLASCSDVGDCNQFCLDQNIGAKGGVCIIKSCCCIF